MAYADASDFAILGLNTSSDFNVTDIDAALDAASAEADGYFASPSSWVTLPLAAPYPQAVKAKVCDIAAYRLMSARGYNPEGDAAQLRLRYEDAIRWLEKVAEGKIDPTPPTSDGGGATGAGADRGAFVLSPQYENGAFTEGPPKPRGW